MHDTPTRLRPRLVAIAKVILSTAIGTATGVLYWVQELLVEERSISSALKGEIEDALGRLEGLASLGGVVGLAVGLLWTLLVTRAEAEMRQSGA